MENRFHYTFKWIAITIVAVFIFSSCQHNLFLNKKKNEPLIFMANDTIQAYLQEAIDYASLENFGFCADDLVLFLENDTSSQRRFENHVLKMIEPTSFPCPKEGRYAYHNGFKFLENQLKKVSSELQNLDAYCRLMAQLDTLEVIPIADSAIINLMHHFEKTDGAGFWEYSGIYYSLLIQRGSRFIDIVRQDKKAEELYESWIREIDKYEFIAFGADGCPPQLIERKRAYLLNLLDKDLDANEVNKLTYNSIKYAELLIGN